MGWNWRNGGHSGVIILLLALQMDIFETSQSCKWGTWSKCHSVSPNTVGFASQHHPAMREASLHSAPEISLGNIGKRQSQVKVWPSKDQHWWICEGLRFRSSSILESTATLGTYMNTLKFGVYSIPLGTLIKSFQGSLKSFISLVCAWKAPHDNHSISLATWSPRQGERQKLVHSSSVILVGYSAINQTTKIQPNNTKYTNLIIFNPNLSKAIQITIYNMYWPSILGDALSSARLRPAPWFPCVPPAAACCWPPTAPAPPYRRGSPTWPGAGWRSPGPGCPAGHGPRLGSCQSPYYI